MARLSSCATLLYTYRLGDRVQFVCITPSRLLNCWSEVRSSASRGCAVCTFVCPAITIVLRERNTFPHYIARAECFFSTRANTDGMAFQHYVLHLESVFSSTIPQSHGRNVYQALVGAVRKFAQQYFTQAQCLSSTLRTIPHGQNVYPALFPCRCPSLYCLTGISCSTQGPPAHMDRLFHHHRGVIGAVQLVTARQLAVNVDQTLPSLLVSWTPAGERSERLGILLSTRRR